MQKTLGRFLGGEDPLEKDRVSNTEVGFPCGSAGKESACNMGDLGSIPELGRSPGEANWLATPVFWPGEFDGLEYSPWGLQRVRHN